MKVFYRKSFGCFVCTDRYVRPWWWGIRHYMPTRPHPLAFLASFSLALVASVLLPTLF
jgi:hypothetical protein